MLTPSNLLFSKFKTDEAHLLYQELGSVFDISSTALKELYNSINETFWEEGWPSHYTKREVFKSKDEKFENIYQNSPVIGIDLPSLMELDNAISNKPTIVIIGQDPKNNKDSQEVRVGTPYGLHHQGSRENLPTTRKYFELIQVLLELGYRVYLTDIYKIWVCNPEKPYKGVKLPKID